MKKAILAIIFSLGLSLSAQQVDTVSVKPPPDSLNIQVSDTSKVDSLSAKRKFDVDAVVNAAATDSLIFNVETKKMFLYGSGEIKYKETDLKGGKIFVNYETNDLEAFGIADTSDTAKVKLKQSPVLKDGNNVYESSYMRYNFKTQRGFISMAKNKEKDSRYEGEKVNKVSKDVFFIEDGMFTTCASDTPHTYFTASQMKVIQRDKIIARWIFMYIGGVPLPIPLPFAVFPNETGRRSGLIIPSFGDAGNRGQYFYNFGYFWAMNDYMDLTFNGDYYLKGGYGLRSRFRYAKRYEYTGNLEAGYSKISTGEEGDPASTRTLQDDWRISWNHNQQIDPSMNFAANVRFQSSNFSRNNSISYNDILTQQIYSTANFSKRWDNNSSLNINYNRTQDLQTGRISETLPNINLSKSLTYPFKRESNEAVRDQKWYELIGYNYSAQFTNNRLKDTLGLKIRGGIQHNLSFSASPKIGYFSVSPSVRYVEKWYNKRIEIENIVKERKNTSTGQIEKYDSLVTKDEKELHSVRTYDLSVSASTKLYGMFQPNMFGIEAFRHTIMPSVSYSYRPDFSTDSWGYYGSYINSKGETIRYDKYGTEVFGGASQGQSQSLNFSLGNVFEMKTMKDPNDTTNNTDKNKVQLLNLNANVGYNFAADSLKLGNLSLGYRTQIGDWISFNGSSSYTFYDFVQTGDNTYTKVNRLLASEGKGLFRLTSFNFSVSTSLSGEKFKSKDDENRKSGNENEEDLNEVKTKNYVSLYDDSQTPDLTIPWNLNLSYNFNLSKQNPTIAETFSNVSLDLGFSITKNWKITMRGSFDFDKKEIAAPQVTIFRDLHCWEMNFTWNPLGYYRGFRFEIRMKAPELQDIKLTKSSDFYSGRR